VLLSDHVTEVDPDAEPYPPLLGNLRLAVGHSPLYLGGTANCVDHAREFGQQPVAGVLYDTAAVFVDLRIDQFPEVRLSLSCVPSSSAPIRREYPATSAARIAVRRRTGGMALRAVRCLDQVYRETGGGP
jgi:hypothetical protein